LAESSSPANEAGFGSTAVRPKSALRGTGVGRRVTGYWHPVTQRPWELASNAHGLRQSGCRPESHAVKSGSGAGGAGAAGGRVVSGAAAEGRSTAAREQTCVMWSEQLEKVA
jgi:hypothetical protein